LSSFLLGRSGSWKNKLKAQPLLELISKKRLSGYQMFALLLLPFEI
jgi:hypothetical protein